MSEEERRVYQHYHDMADRLEEKTGKSLTVAEGEFVHGIAEDLVHIEDDFGFRADQPPIE